MSTAAGYEIPRDVLRILAALPADTPVAALMRHSARFPIPEDGGGNDVPLTARGETMPFELGTRLGRTLQAVHTSPVLRCVQTATALCGGAGLGASPVPDRLLGAPGVFVLDTGLGGPNWRNLGHEAVVDHLERGVGPLPGMADPEPATRFLVHHMLAHCGDRPGVHIFVTHDSLITPTAARLMGRVLGRAAWPRYLDAAFFWREGATARIAYREHEGTWSGGRLTGLAPADVIELARREIGATLGLDCPARFFLAGGAFKTLLHGRPPRDLDLWAPSEADRAAICDRLRARGARPLAPRPFAESFEVHGRVVEVPVKTTPGTLEERLARCDLALAAVGVEHMPGDHWQALIHPMAVDGVDRREVRFLQPLVNWKYTLASLARARRYGAELGYRVPAEEEAAAWAVFEQQPPDMQQGMLERFDRTAIGGAGIREEALCRCR